MFNPADFDALKGELEKRFLRGPVDSNSAEYVSQRRAIATTRRLAESLGMMAPEPAPVRLFCNYEGCDQEPISGSKCGFCEGHEKQERMEEAFYRAGVAHEKGDCTGREYCVFCKSDDIFQQYAMIAEQHEAAYQQQRLSEDK